MNCRRRLPSIWVIVTSTRDAQAERQHDRRRQRAGPVDIGDRQPQHGRCAFAAACRASAISRRRRRAAARTPATEDADEHGGDALVIGKPDRDRDQQRDHQRPSARDSASAAACLALDGVAKQRRHRHVMGAAERPQPEGERGQQAVDERQRQFVRDAAPASPAAAAACRTAPTMTNGSAAPSARPMTRADRGQHDHLGQIDREDVAAGGAQRLEGGDDVAAAVDMALDGVGDADAADQQRGEADQGEELREAARCCARTAARRCCGCGFPSRLRGKRAARIVDQRGRRRDRWRRCRAA